MDYQEASQIVPPSYALPRLSQTLVDVEEHKQTENAPSGSTISDSQTRIDSQDQCTHVTETQFIELEPDSMRRDSYVVEETQLHSLERDTQGRNELDEEPTQAGAESPTVERLVHKSVSTATFDSQSAIRQFGIQRLDAIEETVGFGFKPAPRIVRQFSQAAINGISTSSENVFQVLRKSTAITVPHTPAISPLPTQTAAAGVAQMHQQESGCSKSSSEDFATQDNSHEAGSRHEHNSKSHHAAISSADQVPSPQKTTQLSKTTQPTDACVESVSTHIAPGDEHSHPEDEYHRNVPENAFACSSASLVSREAGSAQTTSTICAQVPVEAVTVEKRDEPPQNGNSSGFKKTPDQSRNQISEAPQKLRHTRNSSLNKHAAKKHGSQGGKTNHPADALRVTAAVTADQETDHLRLLYPKLQLSAPTLDPSANRSMYQGSEPLSDKHTHSMPPFDVSARHYGPLEAELDRTLDVPKVSAGRKDGHEVTNCRQLQHTFTASQASSSISRNLETGLSLKVHTIAVSENGAPTPLSPDQDSELYKLLSHAVLVPSCGQESFGKTQETTDRCKDRGVQVLSPSKPPELYEAGHLSDHQVPTTRQLVQLRQPLSSSSTNIQTQPIPKAGTTRNNSDSFKRGSRKSNQRQEVNSRPVPRDGLPFKDVAHKLSQGARPSKPDMSGQGGETCQQQAGTIGSADDRLENVSAQETTSRPKTGEDVATIDRRRVDPSCKDPQLTMPIVPRQANKLICRQDNLNSVSDQSHSQPSGEYLLSAHHKSKIEPNQRATHKDVTRPISAAELAPEGISAGNVLHRNHATKIQRCKRAESRGGKVVIDKASSAAENPEHMLSLIEQIPSFTLFAKKFKECQASVTLAENQHVELDRLRMAASQTKEVMEQMTKEKELMTKEKELMTKENEVLKEELAKFVERKQKYESHMNNVTICQKILDRDMKILRAGNVLLKKESAALKEDYIAMSREVETGTEAVRCVKEMGNEVKKNADKIREELKQTTGKLFQASKENEAIPILEQELRKMEEVCREANKENGKIPRLEQAVEALIAELLEVIKGNKRIPVLERDLQKLEEEYREAAKENERIPTLEQELQKLHDEHLNAIKENERIPLLEEELENMKDEHQKTAKEKEKIPMLERDLKKKEEQLKNAGVQIEKALEGMNNAEKLANEHMSEVQRQSDLNEQLNKRIDAENDTYKNIIELLQRPQTDVLAELIKDGGPFSMLVGFQTPTIQKLDELRSLCQALKDKEPQDIANILGKHFDELLAKFENQFSSANRGDAALHESNMKIFEDFKEHLCQIRTDLGTQTKLNDQLNELRRTKGKLDQETIKKDHIIESMNSQLSALRKDLSDVRGQLAEKTNEPSMADARPHDDTALGTRNEELESELARLQDMVDTAKTETSQAVEGLRLHQEACFEKDRQVQELQNKVTNSDQEVQSLNEEKNRYVAGCKKQTDSARQECIKNVNLLKIEHEANIREVEEKHAELNTQLMTLKEEYRGILAANANYIGEINELNDRLTTVQEEHRSVLNTNVNYINDNNHLKDQLNTCKHQINQQTKLIKQTDMQVLTRQDFERQLHEFQSLQDEYAELRVCVEQVRSDISLKFSSALHRNSELGATAKDLGNKIDEGMAGLSALSRASSVSGQLQKTAASQQQQMDPQATNDSQASYVPSQVYATYADASMKPSSRNIMAVSARLSERTASQRQTNPQATYDSQALPSPENALSVEAPKNPSRKIVERKGSGMAPALVVENSRNIVTHTETFMTRTSTTVTGREALIRSPRIVASPASDTSSLTDLEEQFASTPSRDEAQKVFEEAEDAVSATTAKHDRNNKVPSSGRIWGSKSGIYSNEDHQVNNKPLTTVQVRKEVPSVAEESSRRRQSKPTKSALKLSAMDKAVDASRGIRFASPAFTASSQSSRPDQDKQVKQRRQLVLSKHPGDSYNRIAAAKGPSSITESRNQASGSSRANAQPPSSQTDAPGSPLMMAPKRNATKRRASSSYQAEHEPGSAKSARLSLGPRAKTTKTVIPDSQQL